MPVLELSSLDELELEPERDEVEPESSVLLFEVDVVEVAADE